MQHTADAGNISVWTDFVVDPVVWCLSQSPGWTSHGPMTRNARDMSGAICHADAHYPVMQSP